jgi:hypothetical protein
MRITLSLLASVVLAACGSSNKSPIIDAPSGTIDAPHGTIDAPSGQQIDAPSGQQIDAPVAAIDAPVTSMPDAPAMTMIDAAPSPCGTCPSGTTCGTANGLPVCRDTTTGIPRFTHVFVIVMENTSYSTLMAATNTPYIQSLVGMYASGSNYHGAAHPSLPNYIIMTSGEASMSAPACDCSPDPTAGMCSGLTCNAFLSACGCPQTITHVGDQLEAAGLSWKDYGEDMGTACNLTAAGGYAPKHVPFLYYDDVQTDPARCTSHVVDYAANFATDLAATAPAYSLIAPNLTHDMHDPVPAGATNYANGDAWLMSNVPPILASTAYTNGGLLVIVWDEDDLSGLLAADDPIPMIVMSPYAKSGGFVSAVHADHRALLATIEDGLRLGRLPTVTGTTPLVDYFPAL